MLLIGMSAIAQTAQGEEILKSALDQIVEILKDPRYADPTRKEEQGEHIWKVVQIYFDFIEIAKRALAINWRKFTPQERREFTEVFSELLKHTYLARLQSEYKNEKIVYLGQKKKKKNRIVVMTKVLRENVETPVDYSMRMRNDTWRVYDVKVEGVSLVKNYRTEFKAILDKETPAQLIERLKKKNAAQDKSGETSN
jgi:phospholipid transport system substrate-binding protein